MPVLVAAGNEGTDACTKSPARCLSTIKEGQEGLGQGGGRVSAIAAGKEDADACTKPLAMRCVSLRVLKGLEGLGHGWRCAGGHGACAEAGVCLEAWGYSGLGAGLGACLCWF